MARIYVHSSIRINIEVTDFKEALTDPSMQILKIYDPAGTLKATKNQGDPGYIRDSQGKYHYDFPTASDAVKGIWSIEWDATIGDLPEHGEAEFVVR